MGTHSAELLYGKNIKNVQTIVATKESKEEKVSKRPTHLDTQLECLAYKNSSLKVFLDTAAATTAVADMVQYNCIHTRC